MAFTFSRYWLRAPWRWRNSVETCRGSVIKNSIINCLSVLHLLVYYTNITETKKNWSIGRWTEHSLRRMVHPHPAPNTTPALRQRFLTRTQRCFYQGNTETCWKHLKKLTEESDINRYCEHVTEMCSRLEHYGAMETQYEPLQIRVTNNLLFNFSFNLIYYLLTSCSRVLLEKLNGLQPVKKFPTLYAPRSFITAFASAHYKWVPVITAWRVLRLRMEERPPIWRVAANILNKQSRTADKGWSSSLGFGRGTNKFYCKNVYCYKIILIY